MAKLQHIPAEALKVGIETSEEMLYPLFMKIMEENEIPTEWKKGNFIKVPKRKISICVQTTEE